MEYKDIFSPKTLEKLNKKSAESLKSLLGDKNLMQTMMSSQQILSQLARAEAPYKSELEQLAVNMVKELYPIIDEEGINLDAKLVGMSDVGRELDEAISPESRRRIINSITQGAALRGAFAFYLFKEHLDELDPSLVEKYNQIMKNAFGIYDDENAIAMMLSALAQGHKAAGGSSKVIIKEIRVNSPYSLRIIKIGNDDWGLVVNDEYLFADTYHHPSRPEIDKYKTIYAQVDIDGDMDHPDEYLNVYLPEPSFGGGGDPDEINDAYDQFEEDLAIAEEVLAPYSFQKRRDSYNIKLNRISNIDLIPTINEIRVNNPVPPTFPIRFNNQEELNNIVDRLKKSSNNYTITNGGKIELLKNYYANNPDQIGIPKQLKLSQYRPGPNFTVIEDPTMFRVTVNNLSENLNEDNQNSGITIRARAICFPMLVHELIKGLYELVSLQGFKGDKAANQAVVDKVDLLKNEPTDIRYGKFIFDALNNIFAASEYSDDPRVREFFMTEIYQLEDEEFVEFIENAINEELSSTQLKWVKDTLRDIAIDLKSDDFSATGLGEIKVNSPSPKIKVVDPSKMPALDLKIGKYDVSKGRIGAEVSFDGKNIDIRTRQRALNVFNKLGIKPERTWVAWGVGDDNGRSYVTSMKSTFVLSHYNREPILIAQTQTDHPQAGQMYIYSKYVKSGKGLRLPDGGPIDDSRLFADRNATKEQILQALKIPDAAPDEETLMEAYADKVVKAMVDKWKAESSSATESISKQLINRFSEIKDSLPQKLTIAVIPDELKKKNSYKDITQYSFEDMVKLIASIPENPDKIKKDAIKNFVEKEGIDRNTAQSYVARFMTKRDDLKFAGKEGSDISKEDLDQFVSKRLIMNNAYLDPRNWTWEPFEQMMDALFPAAGKSVEGEENTVSTDADKIYNKNGIEIYKGDDVHKCISYNPTEKNQKKYGWCVTQPGNTNYDYYRFAESSPTFYFVFDRSKSSTGNKGSFDDQWHAFVLQANADGKSYIVTGANNRGDVRASSWDAIAEIVPKETWNKIKDLKDYFKPIALSGVERGRKFAAGKKLSLDEFKELAQDEKILYIQGKASKNELTPDILAILPQYKINLEGRSTTLANVAIDSGQKFPYASLKDNDALAKRYAVFRFRHTNYEKDPIPLPYIKYLDDDAKKVYLDKFNDNHTFEYVEKFFGPTLTEYYVNKQIKNLDFLPQEATKYIKDPKLKQLFSIYSKLFEPWKYSASIGMSEEELEKQSSMPELSVSPTPINQAQWVSLSTPERKAIIALAEKYDQNSEYSTLIYALPYVIKDGSKTYALVPIDSDNYSYNKWALVDDQGKTYKTLTGKSTLNGNTIEGGYVDIDRTKQRIFGMDDLKMDTSDLKENVSKDLAGFFTNNKSW